MNYCYRFPVVKGKQAGQEYYIGMVPLKMLIRLFPADDDCVLPEYRAQRKLNENRIPEIKNYILNNRYTYVFSALAASIDGEYEFISGENFDVGILEVNMEARFLINDGQHRKAAIIEAMQEDESLCDETIPIVFFEDKGLERSQQMFTDLNKHAVKTSNSIAELYDYRDRLAVITRKAIEQNEFLNEYTDKEKDILGKYSSNLFTLNVFYKANKRIVGRMDLTSEDEKYIITFWNIVVDNMVPWNELQKKQSSKKDLRENYIAVQGIVIQALGRIGEAVYTEKLNVEKVLAGLKEINWKRNAKEWKNRAIRSDGRIIANETAIILIASFLKKRLGIPLDEDDKEKEKMIK